MSACNRIQRQFSHYLDGDVPGRQMQEITQHMGECRDCAGEFAAWRKSQTIVSALGTSKVPPDLALRLRVAISQESQRTTRERLGRWQIRWQNTFQPFLLRAAAGLASAVILIGATGLAVGRFAAPETVQASDEPLQIETAPHLLYSSFEPSADIGNRDNPLILQVFVDGRGRVYDYKVLSGRFDTQTRMSIDNLLLFSVFEPARSFDQPVRGTTLMSFSGVSVNG